MALDVKTGTFQLGTGAATTTVAVTGVGFQPKALILLWSGRTAAGQSEQDHKFGMGFAVSSSSRRAATSQADHGAGTTACDNVLRNDACIATLTIAGATEGLADFQSFDADGFTLVIDDAFPSDYLIHYLALGGSDLTNQAIVTAAAPGGTGDQDITTIGFQPDAALFLRAGGLTINSIDTDSMFAVGVAAGATPANAVLAGYSQDGAGTSITHSYCRSGECLAQVVDSGGAPAVNRRASVTAWLSTGLRLNWTEIGGGDFAILALKGGQFFVGDILSQTGTTETGETGVGFQPKALLLGSHGKAANAADTGVAQEERIIGFATGATTRTTVGMLDKNSSVNADVGLDARTDAMYVNQSTDATIVVEGLMDLVSFDADGFTFVMDDADPSQAFVFYLAMGDAAGGGPTDPEIAAARQAGSSIHIVPRLTMVPAGQGAGRGA